MPSLAIPGQGGADFSENETRYFNKLLILSESSIEVMKIIITATEHQASIDGRTSWKVQFFPFLARPLLRLVGGDKRFFTK
jgi:5'(3')-deoxyribonucleotidase